MLDKLIIEADNERLTSAAQLSILQACPLVISRLLRKTRSPLLAAKVLVISRLLHKKLSSERDPPPLVNILHDRLRRLREKLLRHIDILFSSSGTTQSSLVEAMCAFSLATSSAPTDVLRHFQHVRLDAMSSALERREEEHTHVLECLKLYLRTLQEIVTIFPRRLAEALLKLKSAPLLQDPDVTTLVELNLDVYARWVAEDIQHFTPWVNHEELQKGMVDTLLKGLAKKGFQTFSKGLKEELGTISDFRAMTELRTNALRMWLDPKSKSTAYSSTEGLDELRSIFNAQLVRMAHVRAKRLHSVGEQIHDSLDRWQNGITNARSELWSESITSMDVGNGAIPFKKAILNSSRGRSEAIVHIIESYEKWLVSMEEISDVVDGLKKMKWGEDLDDEEDEFGLENRNDLLSADDPQLIQNELDKAITDSFFDLQKTIGATGANYRSAHVEEKGQKSMFLWRCIRELRERRPHRGNTKDFGLEAAKSLQHTIAEDVAALPLLKFREAMEKQVQANNHPARALWEGTPELPSQLLTNTFNILHDLVTAMSDAGMDLWSKGPVNAIKAVVRKDICESFAPFLKDEVDSVHDENVKRAVDPDLRVQAIFDVSFLAHALDISSSDETELHSLQEKLRAKAGLSEASYDRIEQAAKACWKRTQLLFGLLAS